MQGCRFAPADKHTLASKNISQNQNTPKTNTNLNMLIKSKKQAETTLNNIMSAVEQGVVNKTTNNQMKELEQ